MDQLSAGNQWIPGETWACGLYQLNDGFPAGVHTHLAGEVGQGVKNPATGQIYTPGYSWFTCPSGPRSSQIASYQGNVGVHINAHNYACNEYLFPFAQWVNSPVNYASEAAAVTAYENGNYVPFPPVKLSELERPGSLVMICDSGVNNVGEASDTLFGPMNGDGGTPGIVPGFVADAALESTQGGTPLVTQNDDDLGGALGWPVYSRHEGRCNALMADGHVQQFANGQMQKRNMVSRGKTKRWGGAVGFVDAYYP
jgi:prepilin-type processing-associated H-X9-DG protein